LSASEVRLSSAAQQTEVVDRSAFAGMFDDHASHLYDYCLSLLTDPNEAASAAKVTLIAAYKLGGRMTEPGQLRAWMFALGRRECRSQAPIRREPWVAPRQRPVATYHPGDGYTGPMPAFADAETREFARIDPTEPLRTGFEAELRRVVRMAPLADPVDPSPPDSYTEVLELVQRHQIAPAELPAILDLTAAAAEELLAAAPDVVPAARRDHPGPLAALPRTLWRDTASVVFDPEHAWLCEAIATDAGRVWPDGFPEDPLEVMPPSNKRMAVTSVGLAAALLAPAALGAGLYAAFAVSPHSVNRSHETAIAPPTGSQQPTTNGSGSSSPSGRAHQKARHSITSIFPTAPTSAPILPTPKPKQTTPTTHGRTSSPPVIKSISPSKSPSPPPSSSSPTPTPTPSSSSPSPTPTDSSPTSLPTNEDASPSPTSSPSDPSPSDQPVVSPSPSASA
jgi:DNA-directed RNA polymerase specialized sigma24 family protein